jgi:hypothetical protein
MLPVPHRPSPAMLNVSAQKLAKAPSTLVNVAVGGQCTSFSRAPFTADISGWRDTEHRHSLAEVANNCLATLTPSPGTKQSPADVHKIALAHCRMRKPLWGPLPGSHPPQEYKSNMKSSILISNHRGIYSYSEQQYKSMHTLSTNGTQQIRPQIQTPTPSSTKPNSKAVVVQTEPLVNRQTPAPLKSPLSTLHLSPRDRPRQRAIARNPYHGNAEAQEDKNHRDVVSIPVAIKA